MNQQTDMSKAQELVEAVEALTEGLAVFDRDDVLTLCNQRFKAMHPGMEHLLQSGLRWRIFVDEARQRGLDRGLDQVDIFLDGHGEQTLSLEASRPGDRWVRLGVSTTPSGGKPVKFPTRLWRIQ